MRAFLIIVLVLILLMLVARADNKTYAVTAYCACVKCCGKWSGGPTASGVMPVEGVTVAGPRRIPFGTVVFVEGVGKRVVQDRLARRYDDRFDVYFEKHEDALKFGIRKLKVKIQ